MNKKVLNVGGNSKAIAIPDYFNGWEHLLLDIDPRGKPDILCDARKLTTLDAAQIDAVYCSHNLEHYYAHDVPRVLQGFLHVLKDDGFIDIRVPDMQAVMKMVLEKNLDIEDTLYESPAGPITAKDVFYGYGVEIERTGQDFYAHKTGFTQKSLQSIILKCGFPCVFTRAGELNVYALAFKTYPTAEQQKQFSLPAPQPT
jgi:Methyltransferase domain